MTLKEAINSGCRFRNESWNTVIWYFIKDGYVYLKHIDDTMIGIDYKANFIRKYNKYIDTWILHPEDKFNKKIEDLIK